MIMNQFPMVFSKTESGEGVKSSFAAANTAAYSSLISPDPGLMRDSLRMERRTGVGGIIS